jgi:hypothetical protein
MGTTTATSAPAQWTPSAAAAATVACCPCLLPVTRLVQFSVMRHPASSPSSALQTDHHQPTSPCHAPTTDTAGAIVRSGRQHTTASARCDRERRCRAVLECRAKDAQPLRGAARPRSAKHLQAATPRMCETSAGNRTVCQLRSINELNTQGGVASHQRVQCPGGGAGVGLYEGGRQCHTHRVRGERCWQCTAI